MSDKATWYVEIGCAMRELALERNQLPHPGDLVYEGKDGKLALSQRPAWVTKSKETV